MEVAERIEGAASQVVVGGCDAFVSRSSMSRLQIFDMLTVSLFCDRNKSADALPEHALAEPGNLKLGIDHVTRNEINIEIRVAARAAPSIFIDLPGFAAGAADATRGEVVAPPTLKRRSRVLTHSAKTPYTISRRVTSTVRALA